MCVEVLVNTQKGEWGQNKKTKNPETKLPGEVGGSDPKTPDVLCPLYFPLRFQSGPTNTQTNPDVGVLEHALLLRS